MSQPETVDWQRVQDLVDLIRSNGNRLPDDTKAALKRQLTDRKDLSAVLVCLSVSTNLLPCPQPSKGLWRNSLAAHKLDGSSAPLAVQVLDAVALNCGREVRAYLASPKWMKRYVQNCLERPFTARATVQLLVNWEHVFKCAHHAVLFACSVPIPG